MSELRFIDLLNHALFAHFIDEIGRRDDQIVRAFFVSFELGVHGFIRLIGRIDNLDARLFRELLQQAWWHILGPVIEIERFAVISVRGTHSEHQCRSGKHFFHFIVP